VIHDVPRITIQYVDGCPNWTLARDRLAVALRSRGIDPSAVTHRVLETSDDAERLGFRGSPTILIDGEDPFARPGTPVGLTCRRYRTGDTIEGAPSVAQLDAALRLPRPPARW
jgi:hypothetical protein